jgi:alpha-galactosidase
MVSSGLRDAGYVYVTLDDGWMAATRDASGNLRADPARFPHGVAALAGYLHDRGLRLGIYEDAGVHTCGGLPGSLGHERQDAALFARWGVDYLKYDNCFSGPLPARQRYAAMRDALTGTGRPIVLSICTWGTGAVWEWGPGYGNLWRTTADIQPTYGSMLATFHATAGLARFAGAGGWNDPDMLETGNGMTAAEDRAEVTLWAAMAAPLIAGTDLVHATKATLAALGNRGVVAVDQDPLGVPARVVSSAGGLDVLARPLAGGDVAVVLFNETGSAATIATTTAATGAAGHVLRDLWAGTTATTTGPISATVPPHAALIYRVSRS